MEPTDFVIKSLENRREHLTHTNPSKSQTYTEVVLKTVVRVYDGGEISVEFADLDKDVKKAPLGADPQGNPPSTPVKVIPANQLENQPFFTGEHQSTLSLTYQIHGKAGEVCIVTPGNNSGGGPA